jgi:hypothetical protein
MGRLKFRRPLRDERKTRQQLALRSHCPLQQAHIFARGHIPTKKPSSIAPGLLATKNLPATAAHTVMHLLLPSRYRRQVSLHQGDTGAGSVALRPSYGHAQRSCRRRTASTCSGVCSRRRRRPDKIEDVILELLRSANSTPDRPDTLIFLHSPL